MSDCRWQLDLASGTCPVQAWGRGGHRRPQFETFLYVLELPLPARTATRQSQPEAPRPSDVDG